MTNIQTHCSTLIGDSHDHNGTGNNVVVKNLLLLLSRHTNDLKNVDATTRESLKTCRKKTTQPVETKIRIDHHENDAEPNLKTRRFFAKLATTFTQLTDQL